MTQDERNLLLKDLCARLPYKVKVQDTYYKSLEPAPIWLIDLHAQNVRMFADEGYQSIEYIKPYLFPLSSMTEEQSMELFKLFGISLVDSIGADYIKINECTGITFFLDRGFDVETHLGKLIDWLHKNHFDYRGLIPMGLANDATGLNIY